jgi:lipopolysaccharide biosynthesis protein
VIRLLSVIRIGKLFTNVSKVLSGSATPFNGKETYSSVLLTASRIAIFAHYSSRVEISASDAYLISKLKESGYAVVVSTTCTNDAKQHQLLWEQWNHLIDGLLTRHNTGFDFGSWSAALSSLNLGRGDIDQIVLVNNSVYGPLLPLKPIIDELSLRGDFFALTASKEFCPHLQSYFLGFNRAVIVHRDFQKYWHGSFRAESKWLTIFRRELDWENFFTKRGFRSAVLIEETRDFPRNPLTFLWKDLIVQGFPFMKKSLLTHNYDSIDMTNWTEFLVKECPTYNVAFVLEDVTGHS